MTASVLQKLLKSDGRTVKFELPFDDIMEFSLALLSVSPDELDKLGWTFEDRKRLLNHFLRSGKAAQGVDRNMLATTKIALRIPRRDLARLQRFARRDLPKRASNAGMLDRMLTVLDASARQRTAKPPTGRRSIAGATQSQETDSL